MEQRSVTASRPIFAKVPEPKTAKNRMHLDLMAPIRSRGRPPGGAGRHPDRRQEEYGYTWTVMNDPEGNEFCVAQAR